MDCLKSPFHWGKKEDNPQEQAIHGAIAANIFNKPGTERETQEALQEDFLITSSYEVIVPLMAIVNRDATPTTEGGHDGMTNFSALAAAARLATVRRCTNLTQADQNIGRIRNRILFRKIASHANKEDIRLGILNLIDVAHDTADETLTDSFKGWKTKCVKLRTDTHEVIMTKRTAPRRFGMGGDEQ